MNANQFAVATFDDGLVSEVPVEWLTDNNTYCWWPKSKNPTFLIKRSAMPISDQPENWEKCHVQVETYCESYKVARNKAQDINYTESEDNQEIGKGKRRIFKKKKHYGSSSSEEEEDTPPQLLDITWHNQDDTVVIPLDGPPTILATVAESDIYNNVQSNTNAENSEHFIQNDIIAVENTVVSAIKASDVVENPAQKKILELLIEIKLQNIEILEALSHSKQDTTGIQQRFLEFESQLPIKDIAAFDILLEKLKSAEEVQFFRAYVKTIGGSCPKDYINRALGKLISNELAVKCSWLGLRNNKRMEGTLILEIIKDIVLSQYKNITYKDFEHISSEWFRHAAQRLKRQKDN